MTVQTTTRPFEDTIQDTETWTMRAPSRLPGSHTAPTTRRTSRSASGDCDKGRKCAQLQVQDADAEAKEEAGPPRAVMTLENFTGQLMAEWRESCSNSAPAKLSLTLCSKPRALCAKQNTHRNAYRKRLFPERRQFKIRGTDRHVIWYKTASHAALKAPPAHLLRPQQHALYVHAHRRGVQAWMYCRSTSASAHSWMGTTSDEDGGPGTSAGMGKREGAKRREWRRTYEGQEHPDLDGYVLHFLESGAPRWVKNVSAKAYEKAQRKRKAMAARE